MQEKFGVPSEVYPPAPLSEISVVEAKLGLSLPPLIRELYLQIANGGFGPGYGILGLRTGMLAYDSLSVYESIDFLQDTKEYLLKDMQDIKRQVDTGHATLDDYEWIKADYEGWQVSRTTIAYCYWGCNVDTLVDCGDPQLPVFWRDSFRLGRHSSGNLRQWWRDWLDGTIDQY